VENIVAKFRCTWYENVGLKIDHFVSSGARWNCLGTKNCSRIC